jgi:hypothetical protein
MCPASEIRLSPPPAISGALTVFEAVNDRTLWQEISIKFDYLDAKHRLLLFGWSENDKSGDDDTLFFFNDMIYETSTSPALPSPFHSLFHFRLTHFCFYNVKCASAVFFSFWAGARFGTRQTDYISPLLFSAPALTYLVPSWSKQKQTKTQRKKKSKASEHNRLNCDFRF